jgi:hypothetical protein
MKKNSYFAKTFARIANLKPVLFQLGFSALTITAGAQIIPVGERVCNCSPRTIIPG